MRAVNLLPEKHRPRQATGGKSGSSYILIGALGLAVAAVLMYVVTVNSINSDKTDIAEAQAATAQANAQAEQLGAYGDFAKVKAQRVSEVKTLAQGRMDWERLVRELATVLPDGVWIQNAAAAAPGAEGDSSTSTPTSTSTTDAAATGPTLTLQGCARDQAIVAETLVRLRQLQGAEDVKLDHSTKPEAASAATDSASATGDCGVIDGAPTYEFQVAVTFEKPAPATDEPGSVPARLGGGQ
jgi:Tfp pilus assembly protein PilN